MSASHEFAEHTGEVELHLRASTLAELLAEAGRALGGLLLGDAPKKAADLFRSIRVDSSDRAALLVDWLNELIYQAEADSFIAVEFEGAEASDTRITARARGLRAERPPGLVKAATFHGLRVSEGKKGLEAQVILDV
jgi:SHS2 domain-containing protein